MTTNTHPNAASVVTGMDLVVHLTSDPQRSIAFYRDVLGIVPTAVDGEYGGRGAEFEFPDGSTFGVWMPDEEPKKGATVMFSVADIESALSLFRSRGAEISPATETPVCYMAFGADPDGNAFIIHQRKPNAI